MKNVIPFIFLLTLLVSGCSQEEMSKNGTSSTSKGRVFTTSFEQNDSRTYVEDGHLSRWTEGDRISLFDASTLNCQYLFAGDTGDSGGTFFMLSKPEGTGTALSTNYAVYPYSEDVKMAEDGVISVTLPSEQHYAENSYGLGDNTMVAVTENADDTFLKFKNVCGCLKLQLYGKDITVKSITLMGNNDERIAGTATITATYDNEPTICMADDARTSITLDCGEKGVKIGTSKEEATAFWIVVPPVIFEKGITVKVRDFKNGVFTQTTEKKFIIERKVVKPMAAVKAVMTVDDESDDEDTGYQLLEKDKDGVDAVIVESGAYAVLKETPDNASVVLVTGRMDDEEQDYTLFDEDGFLKAMTMDDNSMVSFLYTPDDIWVVNENNEILAEIPYSAFPEVESGVQSRATILTRNPIYQALQMRKIIKDALKKPLKEAIVELIYNMEVGNPNRYIETIEAFIDFVFGADKILDVFGVLDKLHELQFFDLAYLSTLPAEIKDNGTVVLSCEVNDLSEKTLHYLAKQNYGEVVDYTYTLGMNVYDNPILLTPVYTQNKTITGNGKESFNFEMNKKDQKYYYEPHLNVSVTIEIDCEAAYRANIDIVPPSSQIPVGKTRIIKRSCVIYGDKKSFESDSLREALIRLYESTNGDKWTNNENWCSNLPITEWYGVSKDENNLYTLSLSSNNLTGKIEQTFHEGVNIRLTVDNNELTAIDISGCSSLERLDCNRNPLESLNVSGCTSLRGLEFQAYDDVKTLSYINASGCTSLEILNCDNNKLTTLLVDDCTSLKELNCSGNPLEVLDASGCTSLEMLGCGEHKLTTLLVDGCTSLKMLMCNDNELTVLDASGCPSLEELYCDNNKLTTLLVDGCTSLKELICNNNQLSVLDVSGCPSLEILNCDKNKLTTLLVDGCTSLKGLDCNDNQLSVLEVSSCTSLKELHCENNQFTTLDFSGHISLERLRCNGNPLESLNVSRCTSLKGLGCENYKLTTLLVDGCTSLEILNCDNNKLTTLLVDGCTSLKELHCENNQFTTLNFSGHISLESLNCNGNPLESLNVSGCISLRGLDLHAYDNNDALSYLNASGCTSLEVLYCDNHKLTTLLVDGCTSLKELHCGNNQLTVLDVSSCTSLKGLNCENNQITTLDFSGHTSLEGLYCGENPLESLNVSGCTSLVMLFNPRHCNVSTLSYLNVSGCTSLEGLGCENNKLTTLLVDGCTSLKELYCENNQLATLDVSGCTSLKLLYCDYNQFITLDVSGHTSLESLRCNENPLESLNVSGCTSLRELEFQTYDGVSTLSYLNASDCTSLEILNCDENRLTSLLVLDCTSLKELNCRDNQLSVLDISGCTALKYLNCSYNQLEGLDISGYTSLEGLDCRNNKLTTLFVDGCTALVDLNCENNQPICLNAVNCVSLKYLMFTKLTSLNVSGCTSLKGLSCSDNSLTSLNVSGCTAMVELGCGGNQLTNLDVSGCTALTILSCGYNQLSSLDVSSCIALTSLSCSDNYLMSLNVSGCASLKELWCHNNPLKKQIPAWFTELDTFRYDIRYSYRSEWDDSEQKYVTISEDNGKGWWYSGEPAKGGHSPY